VDEFGQAPDACTKDIKSCLNQEVSDEKSQYLDDHCLYCHLAKKEEKAMLE